jgi:hypothetical protein
LVRVVLDPDQPVLLFLLEVIMAASTVPINKRVIFRVHGPFSLHTGVDHVPYAQEGTSRVVKFESEAQFNEFVKQGLLEEDVSMPQQRQAVPAVHAAPHPALRPLEPHKSPDVALVDAALKVTKPPVTESVTSVSKQAVVPVSEADLLAEEPQVPSPAVSQQPSLPPNAPAIVECKKCGINMNYLETAEKGKGRKKIPIFIYQCSKCGAKAEATL